MRNVVFVAPFPLETTLRFARAAGRLDGVRLLGICCEAPGGADARLFADTARVEDALNTAQLIDAARALERRHGRLHRILGILEPLQVQLAEVRRALGVLGPDPRTAELFRDKARMKDELRRHGLPCARHCTVTSLPEAEAFAAEVGYPLVLKPLAGMACKATWRISNPEELRGALESVRPSAANPVLAEEFLRGREYSFETITVGGQVRFHSFTRYLPAPLEVVENPWIQWVVLHPRIIDGPEFDDARELGVRAVQALGLETGFTHMEWFRRDDGTLAIGEIAARPPGANIVSGNNFVHDADLYRAWARAVIDEAFDGPWTRKYSVGIAFLRGMGRGRVAEVTGLAEANARLGAHVVEARLPTVGAPKADTYEGDGYIIVRDPDLEVVKQAMKTVIETVRVRYL